MQNEINLIKQGYALELGFLKGRVAKIEATEPRLLQERVVVMQGEFDDIKKGNEEIKTLIHEIFD